MRIVVDNLEHPDVHALLTEHLHSMTLHTPAESIHALKIDELRKPEITFWTAWGNEELLGCGALKELDPQHGEIKCMRTASNHLRKGVAKRVLSHILDEAQRRGYKRVSLETGSMKGFEPARLLYSSFGFTSCLPVADYIEDPYSMFMTKEI